MSASGADSSAGAGLLAGYGPTELAVGGACVLLAVRFIAAVWALRPRGGPPVPIPSPDVSAKWSPKGADVSPNATATQVRAALRWREQHARESSASGAAGGADDQPEVPEVCLVTGGTGFVGQRLVEMLVERGARRVISFDVVEKPEGAWDDERIEWRKGDVTDLDALVDATRGVDCVWHNAAAVGPFHPQSLYDKVNHIGTRNVIEACKRNGVRKIVMSTSPSTRFDGSDVDGLTERQMPKIPMPRYLQAYAASKAAGEKALTDACCDDLMTVAVAPHQVYGPRDNLFLPNILEAAGNGMLRVFASGRTGHGLNRVCFTYVDNYAHGLIIAAKALYKGSPALGKFYIVTDGDTHPFSDGYAHFWEVVDRFSHAMGFTPISSKWKLPAWLLLPVAYICDFIGLLTGKKLKLNPFNVRVLVMHRWFRIDAAREDLGFEPIISFDEGVADTAEWTKQHWLPDYLRRSGGGLSGIAAQSQRKIDIQAKSAERVKRE